MLKRLSTATPPNVDKRTVKTIILSLVVLFLASCGGNDKNAPDVSKVNMTLKTQRFDRAWAAIDTNHIAEGLQKLKTEYPDFLNFYLDTLIGIGVQGNFNDTTAAIRMGVRSFLTHKDYRGLMDTIAAHYPDTKNVDDQLLQGFKYLKYYFPETKERKVIYISAWLSNIGAFSYGDNTIGLALDMFLGPNYPYYKSVGIPDYWSEQLKPDYIPVAVFKTIYRETTPFRNDNSTLLDMMIQRGKEAYYVDQVLPDTKDAVKLAYTEKQLQWCQKNEADVYNFFIKQNYLYETSLQKIFRYVTEGPNSAGMSEESPGNIGTWLGLQIVKAYMKEHPKVTLAQLVTQNQDAQTFLQESKYKPK